METYINRDGVHLTPEANKLIAPAILKCLLESGKLSGGPARDKKQ
jgi:hypothetical protein